MSVFQRLTALMPFGKKEVTVEYFFALNIGPEKLTAAIWVIEGSELKVLETASDNYSSENDIVSLTDKLLDAVLGSKEIEPRKILFGVPNSWIIDENLKDEKLKILKNLVKELELTPMAYVATSNALIYFLEKKEGVPPTAILVGFEKQHLVVTVVRAGKLDGVKVVTRGDALGSDIEKALLTFTDIETLPSKILIYGEQSLNFKSQLLAFSWMSKLAFLHFPKIEALEDDIGIKSVCLAGGSEINSNIKFIEHQISDSSVKPKPETVQIDDSDESKEADFGFVVGDVSKEVKSSKQDEENDLTEEKFIVSQEHDLEIEDFEKEDFSQKEPTKEIHKKRFNLKRFIPKRSLKNMGIIISMIIALILIGSAYILLVKAQVKIFVEPKIIERDTQVVADPKQTSVNEDAKIIPGQVIETDVSGSAKDSASGKKQIGDPAKGMVRIYNATDKNLVLKIGQVIISDSGVQIKLDKNVEVASKSASAAAPPSQSDPIGATAVAIGADGNIPSTMELKVGDYAKSDVVAKSEGNFSGGTSKEVTVVSNEDQQRLLAKLSSDLRKQAQQKLQEKYPNKKIPEEALLEQINKKIFNKNINDQASEFTLSMTIRYKGTAFDDNDLKLIVSKLVNLQVPDGFKLDISATETQADVSKLEKDGRLIFLARFKAKLIPLINIDKIKKEIKFKSYLQALDFINKTENVLDSEITISPAFPKMIQRMPILSRNIIIEVGLK